MLTVTALRRARIASVTRSQCFEPDNFFIARACLSSTSTTHRDRRISNRETSFGLADGVRRRNDDAMPDDFNFAFIIDPSHETGIRVQHSHAELKVYRPFVEYLINPAHWLEARNCNCVRMTRQKGQMHPYPAFSNLSQSFSNNAKIVS